MEGLEIPRVPKLGFEVRRDPSFSSFRETKSDERSIEPLVNQKFYKQLLNSPPSIKLPKLWEELNKLRGTWILKSERNTGQA